MKAYKLKYILTILFLFLLLFTFIACQKENPAGSPSVGDQVLPGSSLEQPEINLPEDSAETTLDADLIVTKWDGFTYQPIPEHVISRITNISYQENPYITLTDLSYLQLKYVDFDGNTQIGELICNTKIADSLTTIFYELYQAGYPIASVRLIDDFDGDDTASMNANNTSCFNYRTIAGTDTLSNHSYGMAIDINPLYNPYVSGNTIQPASGSSYTDRNADFPGKIDENDLCYELFTQHGFTWGGSWESPKDYQHFERIW